MWTRAIVGDLIALLYRVRLTEQDVGKYPKRWGLPFQRPDKRAIEQNPEAVRARREERWPTIRAKAREEGAEVLFADQSGVRSDQVSGRTRAPRGRTPTMRRTLRGLLLGTPSATTGGSPCSGARPLPSSATAGLWPGSTAIPRKVRGPHGTTCPPCRQCYVGRVGTDDGICIWEVCRKEAAINS
ncbi:hypothetical protein Kpho02_05420 [Kitasatospora phosalacinea]|uniref:Winged helix-turn helix domain-containing protein n=1 Tax=Kitasatospora phosalacinea TaxID=2065 RepID=A0A9W6Q4E8_9ACTN|nr:hypothetical protein Kpho02_05420 [Kitasatospora phosalacinea]